MGADQVYRNYRIAVLFGARGYAMRTLIDALLLLVVPL